MNINTEDLIWKYEIEDFSARKHKLIESVYERPSMKLEMEDGTRISNTNFYLESGNQHGFTYSEDMKSVFDEFFRYVYEVRKQPCFFEGDVWHQVYSQGDQHVWHTHPRANMASVMYILLPNEDTGTTFRIGDTEFTPKVKEGEIISFPASLSHRSVKNEELKDKMVVSFNWNTQ